MTVTITAILSDLKKLRRKRDGDIYLGDLKPFIKQIGQNTKIAQQLWRTGYDAARELAVMVMHPADVTHKHVEEWVADLNEWGLCDGFVARLVRPTKFAVAKAHEWAAREAEYERRAGFSLMAQLAWQRNEHADAVFREFLPLIEKHADDDRLYVKKAVNWALRDIGKRNAKLKPHALRTAARLQRSEHKTARWVGTHRMAEVANAYSGD